MNNFIEEISEEETPPGEDTLFVPGLVIGLFVGIILTIAIYMAL